MNNQQIIKNNYNNKFKYNQEKNKKIMLMCIAILTFLFTTGLFTLSQVDVRGCDGEFGGLSGDCTATPYVLWGLFSIPLTVLSLVGGFSKKVVLSLIGSILFLVFNFLLLFIDYKITMTIVSIVFSGILFIIELHLLLREKIITIKSNEN